MKLTLRYITAEARERAREQVGKKKKREVVGIFAWQPEPFWGRTAHCPARVYAVGVGSQTENVQNLEVFKVGIVTCTASWSIFCI